MLPASPPPKIDQYGAFGGMRTENENKSNRRKPMLYTTPQQHEMDGMKLAPLEAGN
jgi:hypothetical protein